jgi:hypothetical protein
MTLNYESIVTAAQAAVAAEARHTAAQAALAAAEAERDTIAERVVDLTGRRAAVVLRRQEGRFEDGDAGALSLLDADLEGLGNILRQREANVAAARVPADAAAAELATARFSLRRAEALAAEAALGEHASGLVEKLLETLARLGEVGAQIGRGGRATWHPPGRLMDELRRIDVQRQRGW